MGKIRKEALYAKRQKIISDSVFMCSLRGLFIHRLFQGTGSQVLNTFKIHIFIHGHKTDQFQL